MSIRSSASARTRHSAASRDASPQSIASPGSKIPLSSAECPTTAAARQPVGGDADDDGQRRAARGTLSTKNMANRIIAALKRGDAGPTGADRTADAEGAEHLRATTSRRGRRGAAAREQPPLTWRS